MVMLEALRKDKKTLPKLLEIIHFLEISGFGAILEVNLKVIIEERAVGHFNKDSQ